MQVKTPIKVRYAETDMMGVVYHANYLLYFEEARTDFLDEVGYPFPEFDKNGFMCPVHSLDVQYGEPLRYGEDAYVLTSVVENRPTKTTYLHRVFRADMNPETDKPLVTGRVTACVVDKETFRPVSIKRNFPELYALYETIVEPLDSAR